MDQADESIPVGVAIRLRSAADAVGVPCGDGAGSAVRDVLAWLDREAWVPPDDGRTGSAGGG